MLKMSLRIILLSIFLLSIIPGQSYSFSGEEHALISKNAFLVSLTHAKKTHLISEDEEQSLRSCFTENDNMNYGYLSRIVDDVTDPSKLMKLYGPDIDVGHGVDCSKAKTLLRTRKIMWIDKIMASKYNEDHFQGKTLTRFREFNDLAQLYALRGNLVWALVLNAFAAHYLEDFFAPGHVLTPRTEVNNISARALHDSWDKEGAQIRIKTTGKLTDYLDIIKEMNGDAEEGVRAITTLKDNHMRIYGDGLLKKTTGQKELMIAEVAKTITAVFNAYKTHEISKFDSDYVAEIKTEKKSGLLGEDSSYEEISPMFDDVAYKPIRRDYLLGRLVPIIEIAPYLSTPLKSGINSRWGLEADLALYGIPQIGEDSAGSKFFDTFLVGIALGYDYTDEIFNATNYSHGPLFKFIFDIKNTDIGFCLYAKWKFNNENDNTYQSFPFGGRMSFSRDFFSLYVGIGNEPRYTNKLENIITVYTGLTVFFPVGMTFDGMFD
jgi:hypothetical protein